MPLPTPEMTPEKVSHSWAGICNLQRKLTSRHQDVLHLASRIAQELAASCPCRLLSSSMMRRQTDQEFWRRAFSRSSHALHFSPPHTSPHVRRGATCARIIFLCLDEVLNVDTLSSIQHRDASQDVVSVWIKCATTIPSEVQQAIVLSRCKCCSTGTVSHN